MSAAGSLAPLAFGCACCCNWDFDPVPGLPGQDASRQRRRRARGLLSSVPCSANATAAEGPRNIIADGQKRFEIGEKAREQPDWEPLSDRVICVLGQNPSQYTLNGTNCYLVGTGPKRLLVDAGEEHFGGEEFMGVLGTCMAEHDVKGLDGILVTHMHHDHYGNVGRLQQKYGPVPVYVYRHQNETGELLREIIRRGQLKYFLDADGQPRFNPKTDVVPTPPEEDLDVEWAAKLVSMFNGSTTFAKMSYLFFFQFSSSLFFEKLDSGEYPCHPLRDGDLIHTEGATLMAMHTPGHSSDHMAFLLEEEHAVFSGDHVLGWGTTLVFDMHDYMATLKRMLMLRPTRLYPGHGGFIADGVDLLSRYIEHRETREAQAWQALQAKSRPVSLMEVVRELYPNTAPEKLWMAKDNVEKLFRKFAADGSAAAWTVSVDASGTETLVPFAVPKGYAVRRLDEELYWGARRSMSTLSALQSRL